MNIYQSRFYKKKSRPNEQDIENATVNLSLTQKKILAALSENVFVTQSELTEKIGIHRTRINDYMAKLKEMGVIRCIGSE
ncbi:winged helix-turn-helix domain-containing protein [Treponema sp.]|uniref:winged helix-turn-helix domain-containing protein n=1 Tax=Treponema sp. TaxID=166 RepID=UPI00345BA379|nr:winged helix-turn-helix domain-containing protein [bacterium]MBQ6057295.1 winged helix-turn-helix domain-containing protein [Treponema sp.]